MLILSYPGCYIRSKAKDNNWLHTDKFGDFEGSYFSWVVDPVKLAVALSNGSDSKLTLIGFGKNWKQMARIATKCGHTVKVDDDLPTKKQYHTAVWLYRKSKEYRDVDLKHLKRFGETDLPIWTHVASYMQWKRNVHKFVRNLHESISVDRASKNYRSMWA